MKSLPTRAEARKEAPRPRDITQRFVYPDDRAMEKPFDLKQLIRLLRYMSPYAPKVAWAVLVTVAGTAATLVVPLLIRHAIDFALATGDRAVLVRMAVYLGLCYGVWWLSAGVRIWLTNWIGQQVLRDLRQQLFQHIQYLSFNFFDRRSAGSILVRVINDVNALQELFTNGVVNVLMDVLILTGIVAIMLGMHPGLAVASIVILPVMILLSTEIRRRIRRAWREVRIRLSRINSHLAEAIQGMRVTGAFVQEHENMLFFDHINDDYRQAMNRSSRVVDLFRPVVELTGAVGTTIVYWYGARLVIGDALTVGLFVAFVIYLGRFWEPISRLGQVYNQVLQAMASSERIFELMDTEPTVQEKPGAISMPPISGRIRLENVSFAYRKDRPALYDVSLEIEPGETVALVGPTGSGKTTIVNLICRFYDVTEGRVTIDGHDVRDVTLASLRSQIGIVLQDTFLFSGTIGDNVRFSRPDATPEQVRQACAAVGADAFIQKLPQGYDTEVSERGSGLSLGQRQLISFARALLADPRILILDEATASVDTESEVQIQKALERLLADRTAIVVAHRLSTIRNADKIIVLDHGRIVESGNHESLMKGGLYRSLVEAQFKFLEPDDLKVSNS